MIMQSKFKYWQTLKLTVATVVCSMIASSGPVAAQPATQETSPIYQVVKPTGDVLNLMIKQVPRLDKLDGKTICIVSNGGFKSQVTMPVIEDLLRNNFPNAKLISPSDMPRPQKPPEAGKTNRDTDAMITAIKDKGCQALISGNGG